MGGRACCVLLHRRGNDGVAIMRNSELLFSFLLAVALLCGSAAIIDAANSTSVCDAPLVESWSPPNVSLCPADLGLWECIKGVRYARNDI